MVDMKQDSYQLLNQRLEEVLDKLQAPDVQVDEAVKLYEEGLSLVTKLEKYLEQAENTIEKFKPQAP